MRLSELCRRSGLTRSTIKFYIREGLLPAGEPRARNQATYGPAHLERLALITALREVAGLSLEVIGRVTAELDRGWEGGADPVGEALRAIYTPAPTPDDDPAGRQLRHDEVRAFLHDLSWTTDDERFYFADELAETLRQVRRHLYPDYPVAALAPLARVAWLLSEVEFETAPGGARVPVRGRGDDLAEPTRRAILASILFDRVFGALHRCANAMRSIRISEGLDVPPAQERGPGPSDRG